MNTDLAKFLYRKLPGAIVCGDSLALATTMPRDTFDTIITDPPYGLSFMGKDWDHGIPGTPFWEAFLRIAKPGAMLLAFGGTRTHHRLMCAIEDAGWQIRDCLMWVYGSGFPKSHSISKAIPAAHARRWDGWGTALKPAWEPIILAMKPLDGTFAHNALTHGVSGLNIDGGRIATTEAETRALNKGRKANRTLREGAVARGFGMRPSGLALTEQSTLGRWPANLVLDEAAALQLDEQSGTSKSTAGIRRPNPNRTNPSGWKESHRTKGQSNFTDSGGASRFFYCAKASRAEREAGLASLDDKLYARSGGAQGAEARGEDAYKQDSIGLNRISRVKNNHPCVKPLALMEYLCRLTGTPSGGIVFDPFCGSGSTCIAALRCGRRYLGIDTSPEYCTIARARLDSPTPETPNDPSD